MFGNVEKTAEVSLRMFDEAMLEGNIILGQSTTLEGVLSRDVAFLEFESDGGERQFIAKNKIVSINPKQPLKKPILARPLNTNNADAFTVLGVARDCPLSEAKNAYHALVKLYHPDTYAGQMLPPEVECYMTDMFRQITSAFAKIRKKQSMVA